MHATRVETFNQRFINQPESPVSPHPPILEPATRRAAPRQPIHPVAPRRLAAWTHELKSPGPEPRDSRRLAHIGALVSILALAMYLTWRVGATMPAGGASRVVAWVLITFEALPMIGLVAKAVTVWNIDSRRPPALSTLPPGTRVAVLIPTYNEPAEVIAPTIAAACDLLPPHETWVLDDGDRPWLAELCAAWGARYVCRPVHDHAKAGNMNYALAILAQEDADGIGGADIIAVLDCDHVPLPHFLTATLGWFVDPDLALVQGPQAFYNAGAFDDDGASGEQGLFFNVLMPARNHAGAGPFWCGSTSLLRVAALQEIGGVATETITEDMHTTLKLIRAGWTTTYHHQTLAVGLAPETPAQYLLQRRRWGMGAMQILAHERLWAAKRWLSWRNYYEYLMGTLWWLEGIATLFAFAVPMAVLLSGAQTSTASPITFALVFIAMFSARLWGAKRLMRKQIHWPTAFALRVFRVPVGMACLWWLLSRKTLQFEVTAKGGADDRARGQTPRVLWGVIAAVCLVITTAVLGTLRVIPWRTEAGSTVASVAWLVLAGIILLMGARRIRAAEYATSRRNAYRTTLGLDVLFGATSAVLIDVSVSGAALTMSRDDVPTSSAALLWLPGARAARMEIVRQRPLDGDRVLVSLRVADGDWSTLRTMCRWIFDTPNGVVGGLPRGVPVIACTGGAA